MSNCLVAQSGGPTSVINATRYLNKSQSKLDTIYKRLSSGLRINSAKDDAAGLQISNRLTSQIDGLKQGNKNAATGLAFSQTVEGALDETTEMLQKIRTLANQAATGTNTSAERRAIQSQVDQLCSEITRISCKTTFAGQKVLAGAGKGLVGTDGKVTFQVGANANDTISLSLSAGFSIAGISSNSNVGSAALIVHDGIKSFSVSTADSAQTTLENIDKFIASVDASRGQLGAVQNRLESTISNQENIVENETEARSKIRDTDYAEEAANLTAQNIIQQMASAMLTQGNARGQIALQLLQ